MESKIDPKVSRVLKQHRRMLDDEINQMAMSLGVALETATHADRNANENAVAIRAVMKRLDKRISMLETRISRLERGVTK